MKTTKKITQSDVLINTRTKKYKGVGLSTSYSHIFDVNNTTYEKTTDGLTLFHSNETFRGTLLDLNNANKKEFAKIVVEHFNDRLNNNVT